MDDDYKRAKAKELAEGTEASVDDAVKALEEQISVVEERAAESLDDRTMVDYASSMITAGEIADSRTGGDGETMEVDVLSIGARGTWDGHPATDKNTLEAHAIINGPIGPGGEEQAAKAILLLTEDHVDLGEAQSKLHELNELHMTLEVEEAWNLDGFYRCYSTEETYLTETEIDALPSGRDEKNELLRQMFPDVELAGLAENGNGLSARDPESGYTYDWGADLKRFRGTVVNHYINDNRTWGVYTLMDDSVTPDDIDDHPDLIGDNQQVPGLSVHCEPDFHMNYGTKSVVDVYGVIEVEDSGQIIMRAAGVVPIVPTAMDDGEQADEGVSGTTEAI